MSTELFITTVNVHARHVFCVIFSFTATLARKRVRPFPALKNQTTLRLTKREIYITPPPPNHFLYNSLYIIPPPWPGILHLRQWGGM